MGALETVGATVGEVVVLSFTTSSSSLRSATEDAEEEAGTYRYRFHNRMAVVVNPVNRNTTTRPSPPYFRYEGTAVALAGILAATVFFGAEEEATLASASLSLSRQSTCLPLPGCRRRPRRRSRSRSRPRRRRTRPRGVLCRTNANVVDDDRETPDIIHPSVPLRILLLAIVIMILDPPLESRRGSVPRSGRRFTRRLLRWTSSRSLSKSCVFRVLWWWSR